jgi:CRISPR-associated protein Csb2
MLALGIEFLTGRYVATAYNDRRRAEWPPHPARVFSALVATHFEDPDRDPREREALLWLERQEAPEIHGTEARARDVVDVFVPVNDASVVGDAWRELDEVDEARAVVAAATDEKSRTKARKALEKAESKVASKVAKGIAPIEGKLPSETRKVGVSLLPDQRGKQARTFPSVVPDEPRVTLIWPAAEVNDEVRAVLDQLAARVARLGHSSSLVSMRVLTDDQVVDRPYRLPDPDGDEVLRGVESGQLDRLCEDFAHHQGSEPRVMPAAVHVYREPREQRIARPSSVFGDDWIVLAIRDVDGGGTRLPSSRAVEIARAVRGALQKHWPQQPPPEIVSGHQPAGSPSEHPHLAIVPLPFVGMRHADGDLRGVALILPRAATPEERQGVLRAIGGWEHEARADRDHEPPHVLITLHGGIAVRVQRELAPSLDSLKVRRWCRPSRQWATVTPIALDRHPGDLRARDPDTQATAIAAARVTIVEACRRIGLPAPRVEIHPAAPIAGVQKAREFPAYPPVAGRTRRALTHAVLEFNQEVVGPILVGAGRYHGLGLLFPCDGDQP